MPSRIHATAAALAVALALSACDKGKGNLEKGQVIASVGGTDITVAELNAELAGITLPPGADRKPAEQQALQALVNRAIFANIARERKLDKTREYTLQEHRAEQALLVQMLQRDIAVKLPKPTKEEAARFMTANPDLFAQRKIWQIDQIRFRPPADVAQLKELEPLTTMEQVEQKLIELRLDYKRGTATLDTVGAPIPLVRNIARMPAGEIFIIPQQGVFTANRVTNTTVAPFEGDQAIGYAMNIIQSEKMQKASTAALDEPVKKARTEVRYQPGYAPPKQPAAPAK